MEYLSIGEVARRANVAASAVRYYEQVGILAPPRRSSGRRVYTEEVLDQLRIIALLQDAGFSIKEMHTFLHDFPEGTAPSARWKRLAERKLPEVERRISRARQMKRILNEGLDCRCPTLTECARRTRTAQCREDSLA